MDVKVADSSLVEWKWFDSTFDQYHQWKCMACLFFKREDTMVIKEILLFPEQNLDGKYCFSCFCNSMCFVLSACMSHIKVYHLVLKVSLIFAFIKMKKLYFCNFIWMPIIVLNWFKIFNPLYFHQNSWVA